MLASKQMEKEMTLPSSKNSSIPRSSLEITQSGCQGDESRHLFQVFPNFPTTSPQVLEGLVGKVSPPRSSEDHPSRGSHLFNPPAIDIADIAIACYCSYYQSGRRGCFKSTLLAPRKTLRQLGKEGKLRSSWSTVIKGRPVEKA